MNTSTTTEIITATGTTVATKIEHLEATVTQKITEAKFSIQHLIPEEYLSQVTFLENTKLFNNSLLDYSFAFLFALIIFLILPLVWFLFSKYLQSAISYTLPNINDTLAVQLGKFNKKIFLLIAIYFGMLSLSLPEYITLTMKSVVFALVAIQIAIIIGPLLEPLIKSIPTLNKPELKPITSRIIVFAKTALWVLVGIISLGALGVNTGPLLGSLGVLGLGGALAFQQMMPGFIKILSFHFSKNFSIGDKISAGTHQGVVEEIDISTTRIKKANGEMVEVKNEELMTAIVIPQDGPHMITDTVKINLDIKNDLQTFAEIENIFKKILLEVTDTNFEKVAFTDFKGTGVAVDMNYSVLIDKKIENKHQVLSKLIVELKNKNISFSA